MPLISHFYGILIHIYQESGGKHHKPHFHAKYAEHSAVYDLEGNVLSGKLPLKQHKIVDAWVAIHQDEIAAAWVAWHESGVVVKITGLF